MKFRKRPILWTAVVLVLVVVLLLQRGDNNNVIEYLKPDSSFLYDILNFENAMGLSKDVISRAHKCVSSAFRFNTTATFTMNGILDNLVVPAHGYGKPPHLKKADVTVPESESLQVIVIPHSHNDPGWLKTYQQYFDDHTTHILSLMVEKLHKYQDLTFVWVESCFLDLWWSKQTEETKLKFRTLVESGRLEITSGMWVAPDEASTHYYALIDQMIEGHYWVKKNLGVIPESSLNFDQFGYSSTMPYLAKKAGLKNVLIKRIHRGVKDLFGQKNYMNFQWRQFWDTAGKDDIFAHVDTYEWMSISDSCGPDRAVCRGLDFQSMPDLPLPNSTAARRPMRADHLSQLRANNFHEFAKNLVDQFKFKTANYKYRIMMLPHGGDFRFDTEKEWESQYKNLKIFMKYVNENKEFNVKMKFGTLKDYFTEIDKQTVKYDLKYPMISGDFYTYTENTEYWTGYFTTRQFDKRLSREVHESLRAAELMSSLWINGGHDAAETRSHLAILAKLVKARQDLGVFQHHDAITGTSKAYVAEDYERMLSSAFTETQTVLTHVTEDLLTGSNSGRLVPGLTRENHKTLTKLVSNPNPDKEAKLVLLNTLLQKQTNLIKVLAKTDKISIFDSEEKEVEIDLRETSSDNYEISFLAELPPLSLTTYTLKPLPLPKIKADIVENPKSPLFCGNKLMNVTFAHDTGSPTVICYKRQNFCQTINIDWRYYKGYGGAYTMRSDGNDQSAAQGSPVVRFVNGIVSCGVEVNYGYFVFKASVPITESVAGRALHLQVQTDLRRVKKFVGDFAMRIESKIKSDRTFYVDSNGLQLMGRKFRNSIPFDGNVYPMSSMAILEDDHHRLVVHSAQPHGVVSRTPGVIDFMIDRLQTRPEMGMPEPVKDNKLTKTLFFIELLSQNEFEKLPHTETTLPTTNTIYLNDILQHPVYHFYSVDDFSPSQSMTTFLEQPMSCDVTLANVKNLVHGTEKQYDGTSVTLFRRAIGCSGDIADNFCTTYALDTIQPGMLFKKLTNKLSTIREMYLSHLMEKRAIDRKDSIRLSAMDIKTFHITANKQPLQ